MKRQKIIKRSLSIEIIIKAIDKKKEEKLMNKFNAILNGLLSSNKLDKILDR